MNGWLHDILLNYASSHYPFVLWQEWELKTDHISWKNILIEGFISGHYLIIHDWIKTSPTEWEERCISIQPLQGG